MTPRPKIHLLLTATVDPGGVIGMQRSDPTVRMFDYQTALRWWDAVPLGAGLDSITVCENSGHPIRPSAGGEWSRLQVLSWEGQDFDRSLGKGFGEMQTLITAFQRLAHSWSEHDWVLKCNGRYRVPSTPVFCRHLAGLNDYRLVADMTRNQTWCDSRFFAARVDCWKKHILPRVGTLNDGAGHYFEHALAEGAHELMSTGGRFSLLPFIPAIHGASGSMGYSYWSLPRVSRQIVKKLLYPLKRAVFRC